MLKGLRGQIATLLASSHVCTGVTGKENGFVDGK